MEIHGCLIAEGEIMAILIDKRIIPFRGRLYDKLSKNETKSILMTIKILEQMEEPRTYGKDDDLSDDHESSPHYYEYISEYRENLVEEDRDNIKNQREE